MASDPSFHTPVHDLTVAAVVRASALDASPDLPLDRPIACFAPAARPVHASLVFVEDRAAITDRLAICAAVLCKPDIKDAVPEGPAILTAANPRHAYQDSVVALYPHSLGDDIAFADPSSARQVDGAWVSASAHLEADVTIQPGAVIGDDVHIGAGTTIGAAATIARNCRIGRNARIGPNVSIQYALIGDRVSILAGARIGQEGFGFVPRTDGLRRMPQIGRAVIQEDVEIGANTAVDRGALGDTVIGQGTKIDNLVQIAHNVVIGTHCVIAGNCGISGSVTIGHGCRLGGGVGVADHLTIGDGVSIMAQAGVASSIPDGQTWAGAPAMPVREQAKQILTLRRLADGPNKSPRNG